MAVLEAPEIFPLKGVLFEPQYTINASSGFRINYPLCSNCRAKITFTTNRDGVCINCGKEYHLKQDVEELRGEAHIKLEAYRRSGKKIVSLDLPPGMTEEKLKDDSYFIVGKIGQSNGKRTAVLYMGEILDKQEQKDKVQIFVDIEDGQIRFDKSNMNPVQLLTKITVEFKDSKTTTEATTTEDLES